MRQLELVFSSGLNEPDQEPYRIMNVNAPAIVPPIDGRQSQTALKVARGTARLLHALGFCVVSELPLASGRRADLAAIGRDGEIWIVEIKSSVADFRADGKWMDYRMHCDRLFFATTVEVPCEIFPPDTGLIVADAFGAQIVCEAPERSGITYNSDAEVWHQRARTVRRAQNSANGPCGSASACSRSAAQRAKASIMLLRVDACRRCSGASQTRCAPNASATMRPVFFGKISQGTSTVVAKNSRSQCRR